MLNEVHSLYRDQVHVLLIGVNGVSDWDAVEKFAAVTNYSGVPLVASAETLRAYDILSQSTKIALDGTGEVIFRKSYGNMTKGDWFDLLDELTS